MDQFKHIFGSARIPQTGRDFIASDPEASHVCVMSRNQMYYFRALHSDGSVGISEDEIREVLIAIKEDSHLTPLKDSSKEAIGVCSTLQRSEWADVRTNVEKHSEHNHKALQIIDSALFVLVLDDFIPKNINEAAANCLHGTYDLEISNAGQDIQTGSCVNRWYDKLQLIVCTDGSAGVNFEHSAIDGHTALRFVSDIFADTVVSFAKSITKTIYSQDHIPDHLSAVIRQTGAASGLDTRPKKISLDLPQSVLSKIYYAETALGDQLLQSDTHVLEFNDFGKNFITANGMSPDSFVQMSMMLAYYSLYGHFVCSYEPVLTKWFLHGRTEAMRSATAKAKIFCEKWMNTFIPREEKLEALRDAIKDHSALVRLSAQGQGVDRHLYGLKCIADKNNITTPSFFQDDGWAQLNHTVLSTSNCGNPSLRLFGFGPVVPDGFGIGYIIRDTGLQYTIASKNRQTHRFAAQISRYLLEVKQMCKQRETLVVRSFRPTGVVFKGEAPKANNSVHRSPSTVQAINKTRIVKDILDNTSCGESGYEDTYGENVSPQDVVTMVRVQRKSMDVKSLDNIGTDIVNSISPRAPSEVDSRKTALSLLEEDVGGELRKSIDDGK